MDRIRIFALTLLLLLWPSAMADAAAAEDQPADRYESTAIVGVTIIHTDGRPPQTDATVRIVGERIHSVIDAADAAPLPDGVRQLDGRGKFLIPGLWDMHVHLTDSTETALPALVANGVTGVRDMGGDLKLLDRWRSEIESGQRLGPRIYRTGPYVDGPKEDAPFRLTVTNPKEARAAVEQLAAQKVDLIKIHNEVPRDAFFALAEAADKAGVPFGGHVPKTVRAAEASDAGQKSIEHVMTLFEGIFTKEEPGKKGLVTGIELFKEQGARELFARFATNRTWVTPTLIAYDASARWRSTKGDPRGVYVAASLKKQWNRYFPIQGPIVESIRQRISAHCFDLVGIMHKQGVGLLAGTDLALRDIFPGFSLHDELAHLVKAGLTPLAALQTATIAPARFLGVEAMQGAVKPGYVADLVLLDANPLEKIGNTRRIAAVIVRGRVLERSDLDRLLDKVQAAAPSH